MYAEFDDPQDESNDPSTEQLRSVQHVGDAFCRSFYDCGCTTAGDAHRTVDECRLHVSAEITRHVQQGQDTGLTFDEACLDEIADYFDVGACSNAADIGLDASLRGALDSMLSCKPWSGAAEEGDPCVRLATARGDDCAPDLTCDPDFDVCVPAALGTEGALCGGLSPACASELTCVPGDDGDRCARLGAVDEPCTEAGCDATGWCDSISNVCLALPGLGERCVDSGNAYQWGCQRGLVCDEALCVAAPEVGQPCVTGQCQTGSVCEQGRCAIASALVCDLASELP